MYAYSFQSDYPWIETPLVISAPMKDISGADLAVSVSSAGGLGFIAAGADLSTLDQKLEKAQTLREKDAYLRRYSASSLPVGVGFLNWGASYRKAMAAIAKYRPAAVWLFAPKNGYSDLVDWVEEIRERNNGETKIWVQIGTVEDALEAQNLLHPDVLVVQGMDGGGHGLQQGASIVTLVPEVVDRLNVNLALGELSEFQRRPKVVAAGGIIDGRAAACSQLLGAEGFVMGTRFLASVEADIVEGYRRAIIHASDGGVSTVRSRIYDHARNDGADWPARYGARGIINKTYTDFVEGKVTAEENRELYRKALLDGDEGWGPEARLATYAGTGVGLINSIMQASSIVAEVRAHAKSLLN